MNKKIEEISDYLKVKQLKNDKRLVPFLICIFIATAAWFFNALGKEYSTSITCPVKYVNAPAKRFLSNNPPKNLSLKVDAYGFALLRYKLNLFSSPIILNLTTITKNQKPRDGAYLLRTNSLLAGIDKQISNEIKVTEIRPYEIKLVMDSLKTKEVEVRTRLSLDFMPQFDLRTPVVVTPEKVEITGPATIIDSIEYLYTKQQSFNELDETLVSSVNIDIPEGVVVLPNEVKLQINVEKFTEKEISIPVEVINQPENASIKLFPSEIKLDCLVGLSEFEKISAADFRAVIDFSSVKENESKLQVSIVEKPSFVKLMRFTPEAVEYLIETN